jgi:Fic family protein
VSEKAPLDDPRHSNAFDAELITDPDERAAREASNGLRQIDAVMEMVEYHIQPERPFKLRISTLFHLHRITLDGISSYAGNFRPAGIEIGGSKHQPPGAHLVPSHVEAMCDYINDNWGTLSPINVSAYALWRLNWIHPFTDGNGRTARAISYLLLCLKLGYPLYGGDSVPAQIAADKKPYYDALEAADTAWSKDQKPDIKVLQELLETLLARQLFSVLKKARG